MKWLIPRCPLFGGSTVYIQYINHPRVPKWLVYYVAIEHFLWQFKLTSKSATLTSTAKLVRWLLTRSIMVSPSWETADFVMTPSVENAPMSKSKTQLKFCSELCTNINNILGLEADLPTSVYRRNCCNNNALLTLINELLDRVSAPGYLSLPQW